jgi:hypothetical protein
MKRAARCSDRRPSRLARLFALGLALAPAACSPSGAGSVDFDKPPDAKTIGAPRRAGANAVATPPTAPARRASKKSLNFEPG